MQSQRTARNTPTARGLLTCMLSELHGPTIIALNLERTDIDVYYTERVSVASLTGLLEAIQGKRNGLRSRKAPE